MCKTFTTLYFITSVYRPLKKYYTYPLPARILESESEDESDFFEEITEKPTMVIQDTLCK